MALICRDVSDVDKSVNWHYHLTVCRDIGRGLAPSSEEKAVHPLIEKVQRYIHEQHLFEPGQRVLVGVSGGADSVGLLLVLVELVRSGKLNIQLALAHLEHGIRGEQSRADAEFVADLAKVSDLPIWTEAVDVPALAAERKLCLESAARSARYEFFTRIAIQQQYSAVALAHQADDQAETVLHRVIRGTGLLGLTGIPSRRLLSRQPEVYIVRPMLSCSRAEIEQFLIDRAASWRTDHTNLTLDATRNRIRNELLPKLKAEFNPRVDQALLRLASVAEQASDFLEERAAELFKNLARSFGSLVCIELSSLANSHQALQAAIIRYAWAKSLNLPQRDMSFAAVEDILRRGREHLSSNRSDRLDLPVEAAAVYEFGKLLLVSENDRPTGFEPVPLELPGQASVSSLNLTVRALVLPENTELFSQLHPADPMSELIDRNSIHGQLVIRPPEPDEIFEPLGGKLCTMKELMLSCKIPRPLHQLTGILTDEQGPLWLIGYRIAQRARLRPQTVNAVELSCR